MLGSARSIERLIEQKQRQTTPLQGALGVRNHPPIEPIKELRRLKKRTKVKLKKLSIDTPV
jgi:hypothetical protein